MDANRTQLLPNTRTRFTSAADNPHQTVRFCCVPSERVRPVWQEPRYLLLFPRSFLMAPETLKKKKNYYKRKRRSFLSPMRAQVYTYVPSNEYNTCLEPEAIGRKKKIARINKKKEKKSGASWAMPLVIPRTVGCHGNACGR